jgi:hypothetical protein
VKPAVAIAELEKLKAEAAADPLASGSLKLLFLEVPP